MCKIDFHMISNFEKLREVMAWNFFNLVLTTYGKWFLKMCGNPEQEASDAFTGIDFELNKLLRLSGSLKFSYLWPIQPRVRR